ncbi:K02A2.6-like [Cordylochernes scorpioides]|uniref:K02A2.6-like n=1 Tax=Cordylochernes scorpioides TaxID=51811 RepID=A0ABY6LYE4_9ARAC|nr:K02A2.6-like [Cordylochernes scorpioides]
MISERLRLRTEIAATELSRNKIGSWPPFKWNKEIDLAEEIILQICLQIRVAGIIDSSTQKKLLQEENLTFDDAVNIALSAESADNELHNIKGSGNVHQSLQYLHAINNTCKHCGYCASPLVCVAEPDGQIRLCADFKKSLNLYLEDVKYPIPNIDSVLSNFQGNKLFTKLDLSKAYHQIEMDDNSKKYLVVSTRKVLYKYNRLAFGIKTASEIFQKTLESFFSGINDVYIYFDDILIASDDLETHLDILKRTLNILKIILIILQ